MSEPLAEPFLIESMRKSPTGDIRHNPGRGALGTSAAGFLSELDAYMAAREAAARADERERIAQAIEALPSVTERAPYGWASRSGAARIARGEA